MICFAAFSDSRAAELRGPERKVCDNGYSIDGSACRTYSRGVCSSGNIMIDTSRTTFKSTTSGGTCADNAYVVVTLPSQFEILNSYTTGPERKVCNNGYSIDGSSCRTYTQGVCSSGNVMINMPNTSLKSTTSNGTCPNSLNAVALPSQFEILNSYTLGPAPVVCTNGYSSNRTSCTAYTRGNCPTNYKNLNVDTATFATQTNGACPSADYVLNADMDGCRLDTNGSTCVDFCAGSGQLTGVGTCASLCTAGATTLRTSTGLILPLWSTKQITPSLNVKIGNDVCYVNLVPGQTNESAIMLDVGGTAYHTLEWETPR